MDLVVLAGTIGPEVGWTRGCPRPLLPLGGVTLLETLLSHFDAFTDGRSAVCANGHTEMIARRMGEYKTRRTLVMIEDGVPRGVAGCLKDCESLLESRDIFVTSGSLFLDDDPEWMLARHHESGNALTVFCSHRDGGDGRLRPAGIYCVNRDALRFVRPTGYQDLKEQWVPAIQAAGLRVGSVVLRGSTNEIRAWSDYTDAVERVLLSQEPARNGYRSVLPGVWYGDDVRVSDSSRIFGPVLLGAGVTIEDGAAVVGPSVLGDGCRVGRGAALVRIMTTQSVDFGGDRFLADRLVHGAVGPDSRTKQALLSRVSGGTPKATQPATQARMVALGNGPPVEPSVRRGLGALNLTESADRVH